MFLKFGRIGFLRHWVSRMLDLTGFGRKRFGMCVGPSGTRQQACAQRHASSARSPSGDSSSSDFKKTAFVLPCTLDVFISIPYHQVK